MLKSMMVSASLAVAAASFALPAWGQSSVPGSLLPGQIDQQFEAGPAVRPGLREAPPSLPAPPLPPGAETVRFLVDRVDLDSSTLLSAADVEAATAGLRGREITLADLFRLADQLTAQYRNAGFLLSQVVVPAQALDGRVARLQAIEGYIATVSVTGGPGADSALITRLGRKIRDTRPLTSAALERYMLLINDLPGIRATATLAPSATEFGAADLTIHVTSSRWNASLSIDNRGGKALGDTRIIADGAVTHLLGSHDNTGVRLAASPGGELAYLALQHELQIGDEGGKLSLALRGSQARPRERSFILLDLETRSTGYSVTYLQPLLRSRRQNLFVRGSFAGHDGEERVFGIKDRDDRIRALRAGLSYDIVDGWYGTNLLDMEYSQGLDGLGASRNGDPMLTREQGRVDFRKLKLFAARLQELPPDWSLLAALSGQYAFDDLLASELFGFGGDQFGRGYAPSELVGDHGAAVKLEARHAGLTPFGAGTPLRFYAYYDIGAVWQRSPAGNQPRRESAASIGFGARVELFRQGLLTIELSKPLTRRPTLDEDRSASLFIGLSVRI